jgi:hypothetical protein
MRTALRNDLRAEFVAGDSTTVSYVEIVDCCRVILFVSATQQAINTILQASRTTNKTQS